MSGGRPEETFFGRWSRLKRARDRDPEHAEVAAAEPHDKPVSAASDGHEEASTRGDTTATAEVEAPTARPAALDIDIESLSYESDFTPFMEKGAPDELRTEALRKLWTTDPVFGIIDGLDDYCEDFSDAAWVSPDMKTAYKIGQGFLSDSEIGAGANSGEPEIAQADAALAEDATVVEDAEQVAAPATEAEAPVAVVAPDGKPVSDDPSDVALDPPRRDGSSNA